MLLSALNSAARIGAAQGEAAPIQGGVIEPKTSGQTKSGSPGEPGLSRLLIVGLRLLLHLLARLLHLPHGLRVKRPLDAFFRRLVEQLRVQVEASLFIRLVFFCQNAMLVGPGILPNARDLPRDLHVGRIALDRELSYPKIAIAVFGQRPYFRIA